MHGSQVVIICKYSLKKKSCMKTVSQNEPFYFESDAFLNRCKSTAIHFIQWNKINQHKK